MKFVGDYILRDVGCDLPSSRQEGRAAASASTVASRYNGAQRGAARFAVQRRVGATGHWICVS